MFIGQPVTGLSLGFGGRSWRMPIVIPVQFQLQVAGTFQGDFVETNNFCQVENAGIQLLITVLDADANPLDISGATALAIALQAPDGTQTPFDADYVTNGIDGQLYYVTTAADIAQSGLWYVQGQVTIGGAVLTTAWGQFEANANI